MPGSHDYQILRFGTLVALLITLFIAGCGKGSDQILSDLAAQAVVSRPAAASAMVKAQAEGSIKFSEAMDLAFEKLEAGEDATAFCGAVLDFGYQIRNDLPQSGEFLIFYRRMGQLAARSAQLAYEKGRLNEARSLVLAGPKRWQDESYWRAYPNHDALASIILFQTGEHREAIGRLQERVIPAPIVLETLDKLRSAPRKPAKNVKDPG